MTTFAERQQQRRAAGRHGTAWMLDGVADRAPHLLPLAERLAARAPTPQEHRDAPRELRRTIAANRVLAAKRELRDLAVRLADEPGDRTALARVAQITHYVRDAERSGTVPPLDWQALLERERSHLTRSTP